MLIDHLDMERLRAAHDDVLVDVIAVRVGVSSRGRNAWHSTWAKHYQGGTALFSDFESARSIAEGRRVQGSQFAIAEAPALALRGRQLDIIVVDFHPQDPFRRWRACAKNSQVRVLSPGYNLRQTYRAFQHDSQHWAGLEPNEHSLRSGWLADAGSLQKLAGRPLRAYESRSHGGNYYLGWALQPTRFTRRGTNSIVRQYQHAALEVPGLAIALEQLHNAERSRSQAGGASPAGAPVIETSSLRNYAAELVVQYRKGSRPGDRPPID